MDSRATSELWKSELTCETESCLNQCVETYCEWDGQVTQPQSPHHASYELLICQGHLTGGYAVSRMILVMKDTGLTCGSGDNPVAVLDHVCTEPSPHLIHWDRNPGLDAVNESCNMGGTAAVENSRGWIGAFL